MIDKKYKNGRCHVRFSSILSTGHWVNMLNFLAIFISRPYRLGFITVFRERRMEKDIVEVI